MLCKDCGKLNGKKVVVSGEFVCDACLEYRASCAHTRVKLYKDFTDGSIYSICRNCGQQQDYKK